VFNFMKNIFVLSRKDKSARYFLFVNIGRFIEEVLILQMSPKTNIMEMCDTLNHFGKLINNVMFTEVYIY
jgi:hypothetical protein